MYVDIKQLYRLQYLYLSVKSNFDMEDSSSRNPLVSWNSSFDMFHTYLDPYHHQIYFD